MSHVTYQGSQNAIDTIITLRRLGHDVKMKALRIDSGDLYEQAERIHHMLKKAHESHPEYGFDKVVVLFTNDLNEEKIAQLKAKNAKIGGVGVGTNLGTLQGDTGFHCSVKHSATQVQIQRIYDEQGLIQSDTLYDPEVHTLTEGKILLEPAMRNGQRCDDDRYLTTTSQVVKAKQAATAALKTTPEMAKRLDAPSPCSVSDLRYAMNDMEIENTKSSVVAPTIPAATQQMMGDNRYALMAAKNSGKPGADKITEEEENNANMVVDKGNNKEDSSGEPSEKRVRYSVN